MKGLVGQLARSTWSGTQSPTLGGPGADMACGDPATRRGWRPTGTRTASTAAARIRRPDPSTLHRRTVFPLDPREKVTAREKKFMNFGAVARAGVGTVD